MTRVYELLFWWKLKLTKYTLCKITIFVYKAMNKNCTIHKLPLHSLGATHSFFSSSITVPVGHSHPLIIQTAGQGLGPVLLHVRWQLGCEAHSLLICPLTGQAMYI